MSVLRIPLFLALLCPVALPQEDGAPPFVLETVVVTPTLGEEAPYETPYATEVVDAADIAETGYRSTPQILRELPGVMVQETAHGHGSPYIRGFTSFRNLFLIDGIRLNNSVFRPGPNQYWNTVDPFTIQRLEVVKGPSSVLYGSDAIGGTVNALTTSPYGYGTGWQFGGALHYRGATAGNYSLGRGELSITSGDSLGLLLGYSLKSYGDVRGGDDIGDQPNTGYGEDDLDFKLEHFLGDHARLVVAHQRVDQEDVPRTHSTVDAISFEGTSIGSDLRRDLDQMRELTYIQLHTEGLDGFFDRSTTSLSWHSQEEERDRVRSSGVQEFQGFDVGTLGFFSHFHSDTSFGGLTYGVEYYRDGVDSFLDRGALQTTADDIQGPVADDATYDLLGVFIQDEIQVAERFEITAGARFQYAAADADSVRDPVTDSRIAIDENWSDVVGSLRFRYQLDEGDTVALFGGVSQGFRAPNLSDLTRFDTARSNEFEVPAPDLDPEFTLSYELGVKVAKKDVTAQTSVFYTDIRDRIQRFPTGNTNADGDFEVTKDNVGDGYVTGLELGSSWIFEPQWTVFGNATLLGGKVDTFATSAPVVTREYIDRLMPFTAQLGLRWDDPGRKLWCELVTTHAQKADRLSPRDKQDDERIPPGGTPAYTVFDLRGGWDVNRDVSLTLGIENLSDEDYRIHGSGVNRPGLGLVVGATLRF